MSSVSTRVWGQKIVGYVPHTSVSGDAWQLINRGTASSNGAADGTTVIDAGNDSGGADTYNGRYWARMVSGTCRDEWRRIVDDDGAGTLTLEGGGFSAQIDSGDEYEIWSSPEPVVVVDSSSGETNMVDAVRSEAAVGTAPFWKGYYAIPITGTHRGKITKISSFVGGSGTYTLEAAFGSALAAGDVVLLRKFVEADGLDIGPSQAYHPRPGVRTNLSVGDGRQGAKSGSIKFGSRVYTSHSTVTSGTGATSNVIGGLFEACGLEEEVGRTATVGVGSTTTAIAVASGTWEYFNVGQMVVDARGNATFIDSMTDGGAGVDTLNVSPALPQAPISTELIHATRMYRKSIDGDTYGVCIDVEIDGVNLIATGCKGNVSIAGDDVLMATFEFSVDHWIRQHQAAPYSSNAMYVTGPAILASERIAYLSGTKTNISGFTATPGAKHVPKKVQGSVGANGQAGFHLVDYSAGATFRELSAAGSELIQEIRWNTRTANELEVIFGSHEDTFAVRIPVAMLVELPNPTDAEGLMAVPSVVTAQDAGTSTDGAGTIKKIPDFAIYIA